MKKLILISVIIIGAALAVLVGLGYANPIDKPWSKMNCDQMIEFALSPGHNTLGENQHLEFHKDFEVCVKNKK